MQDLNDKTVMIWVVALINLFHICVAVSLATDAGSFKTFKTDKISQLLSSIFYFFCKQQAKLTVWFY